jgi:hypothetical protein
MRACILAVTLLALCSCGGQRTRTATIYDYLPIFHEAVTSEGALFGEVIPFAVDQRKAFGESLEWVKTSELDACMRGDVAHQVLAIKALEELGDEDSLRAYAPLALRSGPVVRVFYVVVLGYARCGPEIIEPFILAAELPIEKTQALIAYARLGGNARKYDAEVKEILRSYSWSSVGPRLSPEYALALSGDRRCIGVLREALNVATSEIFRREARNAIDVIENQKE